MTRRYSSPWLLMLFAYALLPIVLCCCVGGGGDLSPTAQQQAPAAAPSPQPAPAPPPPEVRPVVFVGDSITHLWADLPGINAGRDGDITAFMLGRFDRDVLARKPAVVVILGGTNDIYNFEFPSTEHVSRMADMAAAAGACVILGTVPPIFFPFALRPTVESTIEPIATWNRDIKMLGHVYGYRIADYHAAMDGRPELFRDGLHPNADGYQVMLGVVLPLLSECGAR